MRGLWTLVVLGILLFGVAVALFFRARGEIAEHRDTPVVAAEFEAKLAEVEARRWPRPPLFDEASTGTAWDCYRQAMNLYREVEESSPIAAEAFAAMKEVKIPGDEIPLPVRDLLAALEPVFVLLRRGACASETGRHFSPRQGFLRDPEVDRFFDCAQLLTVAARVRAYLLVREDPERAVDALLVIDRFGDDFKAGGGAIHFLVGLKVRDSAQAALGELIGAGLLPTGPADRVLARLELLSGRLPDLFEVADLELLYQQQMMEQAAAGEAPEHMDLDSMDSARREDLVHRFLRARALYGRAWAEARAGSSTEGVAVVGREFRAALATQVGLLRATGELGAASTLESLSVMATVVFMKLEEARDLILARLTANQLLVHAVRYIEANGEVPETIEDIARFAESEFPGAPLLFYTPFDLATERPTIHLWSRFNEEGLGDPEPLGVIR
jgi:hypothetical protein